MLIRCSDSPMLAQGCTDVRLPCTSERLGALQVSEVVGILKAEHATLKTVLEQHHMSLLNRLSPYFLDQGICKTNVSRGAQEEALPESKSTSFSPQAPAIQPELALQLAELQRKRSMAQCASTQTCTYEELCAAVIIELRTPPGSRASSKELLGPAPVKDEDTGGEGMKRVSSPSSKELALQGDTPMSKSTSRNSVRSGGSMPLEPPGPLEALVTSNNFELVFALLILGNALMMAAYIQYAGIDTGNQIEFPSRWRVDVDASRSTVTTLFDILEYMFGGIFVIELIAKIVALRLRFVRSIWNWMDFVIVAAWCLDISGFESALNPMMLRLFRLAKLLRIAKLVRSFKIFDSLSILLGSVNASGSIALWAFIVILVLQLGAGIFFSQMLEGFIKDNSNDRTVRFEMYRYFGTFTRAYLSMYELTFGNWVPITRLLTEEVSELYTLLIIAYQYVVSFVFIRIITSVFIFETAKSAATDEDILILQKERQSERLLINFQGVFNEIDDSGDGCVNWEEFQGILHDKRVVTWLSALDFDVENCKGLFRLLDDGDGKIEFNEFIKGVQRLKGSAKAVDLITLSHEIRTVHNRVKNIEKGVGLDKRFKK
jgi:hypothetical protein